MRGAAAAILVLSLTCASYAQPPSPSGTPAFEVASIKPSESAWLQISPQRSGGRISWQTDLSQMILYAYHLPVWRVIGMPAGNDFFQVDSRFEETATEDQVRAMLQSLLASRFLLAAHRETKELNGYTLNVGKSGLKLKESQPGDLPAPLPPWFAGKNEMIPQIEGKVIASAEGKGISAVTGRRVSMAELAEGLERALRAFVLDKTNLTGKYYFAFKFLRDDAPPEADAPTLAQAVQELGLRLEKQKGPVEMLVIDHVEKTPTAN